MAIHTWRETRMWKDTHASGGHFESEVVSMIQKYTSAVWRNIRIETLLTQTGTTEMDVVFYKGGLAYILELKRVRRIVGEYSRSRWTMYGWRGHIDEASEYTAMNVIEQNNIHARSLADLYYSEFRCFPTILPVVIVPNDCEVPSELKHDIFTVQELEDFMVSYKAPERKDVAYRMAFLMDTHVDCVERCDFIERRKHSGEIVRGRKVH